MNKTKQFQTVGDVAQLDTLVSVMPEPALRKVNDKIQLHDRLGELKHAQAEIFIVRMSL